DEGRPRMMGEHKNVSMVRRIRAPPSFPGIILPGSSNRPEHIAAQDPRADIVERLKGKIVIDAPGPAAFALHLLENLCALEPPVQLESANPKGIIQILAGPGAKPID